MNSPINLMGYDRKALEQFFIDLGEKPFRATQILKWIHQCGVTDFDEMTNLGKALREKLNSIAVIQAPEITLSQKAGDGVFKWLIKIDDKNSVETVYIPEDDRGTLCVSSQVGCGLNCSFCSTARQGFNRNLSSAEIIGQVWVAVRQISQQNGFHDKRITNVVMMGMGEPLLNFDPVVSAMDIMRDDFAYGLSKYRVTVSTSGLVPQMEQLRATTDVALAVSLHAPNDELRNLLVPINKKYPLKQLLKTCADYYKNEPRRKVTFEYVMLKDVNDSNEHAKQLAKAIANVPCKMNLIPFNPFPNSGYECSSRNRIYEFQRILQKSGIVTTIRKTRGEDIDAACGQLAGQVTNKMPQSRTESIIKRVYTHKTAPSR